MSKFDTHGGYFSPDNYIRINEGGTHDENPNGGVQMGVDPEGVPNMVEEDETVYDDYVFSDNIIVDDAMVEKHNLPAWAKGKLYSKVTDRLVEEAEERPMDPISRSGLEEMLGRLRDAQEEQKQIQQERELEDELSQLSPEELDQLESMLVQSEQAPVEEYPAAPEQMAGPAEPVQQTPIEGAPMMRNGGTLLRRFDGGGGLTDEQRQAIIDAGPILDGSGARVPSLLELALGSDNRIVRGVNAARDWMENSTLGRVAGALLPSDATQAFAAPVAGIATDVANLTGKIADYGRDITAAEKELAALKKELEVAKKTKVGSADVITSNIDKAKEKIKFAKREMGRLQKQLPKAQKVEKAVDAATETIEQTGRAGIGRRIAGAIFDPAGQILLRGWRPTSTAGKVIKTGVAGTADLGLYGAAANGVGSIIDAYKTPVGVSSESVTPYTGYYSSEMPEDLNFDDEPTGNIKALGGQMNKFTGGGRMRPEDMKVMAVDDNGELVDDIMPSVVVADPPKVKAPFYLPFILPEISEKDEKKQEEAERVKKEKEQAEEDKVNEFARAVYFGNPDATANFLFDTILETPSYGRRSNRFDKGGQWEKLLDGIRAYKKSLTPGGITGTYAIDNDFVRGSQFKTIKELEDSDVYRNFTNYILENSENEDVQNYLRLLDDMTAPGVKRLFVDGKLRSGWKDLYNRRRYDQKGGVYHFSGDINNLTGPAEPTTEADEQRRIINLVKGTPFAGIVDGYPNIRYADINGNRYYLNTDNSKFYTDLSTIPGYSYPAANPGYWGFGYTINPSIPWAALPGPTGSDPNDPIGRNVARLEAARTGAQRIVADDIPEPNYLNSNPDEAGNDITTRRKVPYLSTFPRYAGALIAGGLGLYNAFQRPDRYDIPHINPVLPQGQLHIRDPRYNPLDEEQAVNTVLATNTGTNRQIMNSGIGPSIGATLLASDYNAGRNIGTARQTVWNANNESRNAVTTAHNQNASALAGFDYGQSRDRAQVLNEAAYRNTQNDMLRQRLNYDAEGQKYAAIQSSLDSVAQALSGMGQENSILNALNSNTALYHWLSPNRVAAYKADTNESKDGGFLRKKKTKTEKEIEQQVRDLSEYGETLTKIERDERKKREVQQKIDNLWSPASPSELKRVFSGRKKKKN